MVSEVHGEGDMAHDVLQRADGSFYVIGEDGQAHKFDDYDQALRYAQAASGTDGKQLTAAVPEDDGVPITEHEGAFTKRQLT